MNRKTIIAAGILLLFLAALTLACEDSDVIAPTGSVITLSANPANVFIDQDSGETEGETTLIARVVDPDGQPITGIPLIFTATGGTLTNSSVACVSLKCSSDGAACTSAANCTPKTVNTDDSGFAVDVLTLRLIQDPSEVEVSVQGGGLAAVLMVSKVVNLGPVDPVAMIIASPPLRARTGQPVIFDGSTSTFDPLVDLTCFKWTIDSSIGPPTDECGSDLSVISRTFGTKGAVAGEQDLSVQLRVSDVPGTCAVNCSTTPPFSQFLDTLVYEIKCDFTNPVVDAGGDVVQFLPNLTVNRSVVASDPELPTGLTFLWTCNGGTISGADDQQSVTCVFPGQGSFNMSVTVTNQCGLTTTDGFGVTINP